MCGVMSTGEHHLILLADDSEDDRVVLRNSIERVCSLKIAAEVTNGKEVVAYLAGTGQFADRKKYPIPDLLLLDLNMPLMDGFRVLEWLSSKQLEKPSVVVLTDSV